MLCMQRTWDFRKNKSLKSGKAIFHLMTDYMRWPGLLSNRAPRAVE
jgi:hypothetical protein